MFLDLTYLALRNLLRRKVRSALTLIGILIGMTAIVALISLGQGIQQAIDAQFSRIGYDLIFIIPGVTANSQGAPRELNLKLFSSLENVAQTGAILRQTLLVQAGKFQGSLTAIGLTAGFDAWAPSLLGGYEFANGKNFELGQSQVQVVVGSAAAQNWELQVGQKIQISNKEFTIVGILQPSAGDDQYNHMIFMNLNELYSLTGEPDFVSLAVIKAKENTDGAQLTQKIETILSNNGIRDFTVQSSRQLSTVVGNILRIIQMALASIAGIALLVGGIGLANTVYTSVLERTREIGLLKALGAKRKHILLLFLLESGLLGLLGGVLGLAIGFSLSQSVALFARQAIPNLRFGAGATIELIAGTLLISVLLGAIAGLWPALRASRLRPVEALRYE